MTSFLTHMAVKLVDGGSTIDIPGGSANNVLQNSLNLAYMVMAIIAVIVIIIGGIMFVTSAGNAGGVTKAKNMVLYAVIGIIVILAAYAITNFVIGRF